MDENYSSLGRFATMPPRTSAATTNPALISHGDAAAMGPVAGIRTMTGVGSDSGVGAG